MAGRFPREEEGAGSGEKSAALFGGPAFLLLFRRFFSVGLLGSVVFKRVFLGDTFLLLMSGGWIVVVGKRNKGVVSVPNSLSKDFSP